MASSLSDLKTTSPKTPKYGRRAPRSRPPPRQARPSRVPPNAVPPDPAGARWPGMRLPGPRHGGGARRRPDAPQAPRAPARRLERAAACPADRPRSDPSRREAGRRPIRTGAHGLSPA
eukprot:15481017-Alexandrium_andersonii.AAC.1